MAILDSLDQTTDRAISKSEEFIRNTEAYYELKLFQLLTSSLSIIVKFTIISAMSIIALVLIAIVLSGIINDALESETLGYLLTALLFVSLSVLVYALRKPIDNFIVRKMSSKAFK